jgi:putative ABC transport system permease protein
MLYSIINLFGLAIGISCFILIVLYTTDELSFDKHHSKAERIYRVNEFYEANDGAGERSSSLPFPVSGVMQDDYADIIEQSVRVFNFQAPALTVKYEPKDFEFNERRFFFVDSTYANVFDLSLSKGTATTALDQPNTVVISETIAAKYFPNDEPMGKLLRFQDRLDLMVTGVMPDMPLNSHFHADFLASFSTLKGFYNGSYPDNWFWNPCWTYLLLREGTAPAELNARFPDFVRNHFPADIREDVTLRVQALTDIHLRSKLEFEIEPNGDEADVYTFIGIAFFVLGIACLNFVNLMTATSVRRSKEVGLRKTLGSSRRRLFLQFLSESVIMSVAGVLIAIILSFLALPLFNGFTNKELTLDILRPDIFFGLISIAIIVGILSGIYPAVVISSYRPLSALKLKDATSGKLFRKSLVAIQFALSFALIIFTMAANRQLTFLQKSDMGFQRSNIIMVPVMRTPIAPFYKSFTDRAKEDHTIEAVTTLEEILGSKFQTANYRFEGSERASLYPRLNVRHDFLETFQIPLLAGRDYSIDQPTDDSLALVVNESLVRGLDWTPEDAIGRSFQFGPYNGKIAGVCKDFNFTSKHSTIGPLVLHLNTRPGAFNLFLKYMAVRISGDDVPGSIERLKDLWDETIPSKPFEYFFLDNELDNLYRAEANLSRVVISFSSLAILVACLGLFGLASYDAETRKREISIRKVFGGSVATIMGMVLSQYIRLLVIAILVASPLVYFALSRWLTGFAYHIDMPVDSFVVGAVFLVAMGVLAVGYKSWQAAAVNPVKALKE